MPPNIEKCFFKIEYYKDDIEKINHQFKEEQVVVNDKKVELKFVEEKSDLRDNEENSIYFSFT